jgi:hypothetical protein
LQGSVTRSLFTLFPDVCAVCVAGHHLAHVWAGSNAPATTTCWSRVGVVCTWPSSVAEEWYSGSAWQANWYTSSGTTAPACRDMAITQVIRRPTSTHWKFAAHSMSAFRDCARGRKSYTNVGQQMHYWPPCCMHSHTTAGFALIIQMQHASPCSLARSAPVVQLFIRVVRVLEVHLAEREW